MAHNNNYEATVDEAATVDHLRALSAGIHLNEQPRRYPYGRRSWADDPDIVMRTLNIAGRHTTEIEYVTDRDWSRVVLTKSHQTTLRQLCAGLRIPPPGYLKETVTTHTSVVIHRFIVAIPPGRALEAMSAAGRYSTDELLAREDGTAALAWMMLRAFHVVNYDLNNELLEDARAVNDELRAQNSRVNREFVNYRDGYPYDARESSNSSEEYYPP